MSHRPAGQFDCGALAGDLPAKQPVRRRRADRRCRGPPLSDQRSPLPVCGRGGAATDRRQRLGSAAPRDRPRPPPQPACVLHPRGTEHDQRMDRPAGVGLGSGRLGSGVPDLAPARMDHRARRPAVRPRLSRGRGRLEKIGHEIERAESRADIERLLVEEPVKALRLASAALFREEDGVFRRSASIGWGAEHLVILPMAIRCFQRRSRPRPSRLRNTGRGAGRSRQAGSRGAGRQPEAALRCRPLQRARVGNGSGRLRARPSRRPRRHAEIAYGQVERETLQQRVEHLEGLLRDAALRA